MLTKGMIMTVLGVVGIVITIVTFIVLNKNINKQLNLFMESQISSGQYESSINDKISRYVMKNRLDIFENQSTIILEDYTTLMEEESTTLL